MTRNSFIAACVQTNSKADRSTSLADASIGIEDAAKKGARLILTPENVDGMPSSPEERLKNAQTAEDHEGITLFQHLAKKWRIWLVAGSFTIKNTEDAGHTGPMSNRSYLFSPDGRIAAFYNKIHLFDAVLSPKERYVESDTFCPGTDAVVVQTDMALLGMTICYDLRFPALFQMLAQAGAELISVPAAFTETTGRAHWKTLLQARAIENSRFILAPAQGGVHANGRKTWGHSLIIDPWGHILAEARDDQPCVITATITPQIIHDVEKRLPTQKNQRRFTLRLYGTQEHN